MAVKVDLVCISPLALNSGHDLMNAHFNSALQYYTYTTK